MYFVWNAGGGARSQRLPSPSCAPGDTVSFRNYAGSLKSDLAKISGNIELLDSFIQLVLHLCYSNYLTMEYNLNYNSEAWSLKLISKLKAEP